MAPLELTVVGVTVAEQVMLAAVIPIPVAVIVAIPVAVGREAIKLPVFPDAIGFFMLSIWIVMSK